MTKQEYISELKARAEQSREYGNILETEAQTYDECAFLAEKIVEPRECELIKSNTYVPSLICTNCHLCFDCVAVSGGVIDNVTIDPHSYKFCPNCGAKVIKGGAE